MKLITKQESQSRDGILRYYKNSKNKWYIETYDVKIQALLCNTKLKTARFPTRKEAYQTVRDACIEQGITPPSDKVITTNIYYYKHYEEVAVCKGDKGWMVYVYEQILDRPNLPADIESAIEDLKQPDFETLGDALEAIRYLIEIIEKNSQTKQVKELAA